MCMLCNEMAKMNIREVISAYSEMENISKQHKRELSDKVIKQFGANAVGNEISRVAGERQSKERSK